MEHNNQAGVMDETAPNLAAPDQEPSRTLQKKKKKHAKKQKNGLSDHDFISTNSQYSQAEMADQPTPVLAASAPEPIRPPKRKKKKTTRNQKIKLVVVITIAVLFLGAIGFGIFQIFKEPEKTIPTTAVMRGTLETVVRGSGIAMPKEKDDVVTLASGKVTDVFVKNGDKVEEGTPLFTVDTTEIDSEINEAYASLDRITDDLSKAYKKVANLDIAAPFAGKTLNVTIKKGDQVSEGSSVATMVDDSKMRLKLYFSYAYIEFKLCLGNCCIKGFLVFVS